MTLSQNQLSEIAYTVALIEGVVTEPIGFHIVARGDFGEIYETGKHIPGLDFKNGVRACKVMLKMHGVDSLPPNDIRPGYGGIPIKIEIGENWPVHIPKPHFHGFSVPHIQRLAELGAVYWFDKTKNEYRYYLNVNGERAGDAIENDKLSAGTDLQLLSICLQLLSYSLGAEFVPPFSARQNGYWFYLDAIQVLEVQLKPAVTPIDAGNDSLLALEKRIELLERRVGMLGV